MNDPAASRQERLEPDPTTLAASTNAGTDASSQPVSGIEAKDAMPKGGTFAYASEETDGDTMRVLPPAIPGYTILGVLGRGGMGIVYKARELALDRLVALKVVTAGAHATAEQLARFRSEARAEARLQHSHIVQVHAVGEHEGFPFLSLEYMEGGSLAQRIRHQPQPPREAAQMVYLLAHAMAYAHQRGVIHRDLKPANILLSSREDTPSTQETPTAPSAPLVGVSAIPKIADFGLAKCLGDDSGHTRTGNLLGTPRYMSPEQAEGRKDIGPATDIWALGVILYELLVGRTPFQGVTTLDTLEQVRTREPVPPTQLQPKLPADLETICLKCLQKEAPQRYATAEELAEDLRRFLSGEPIRARPVGLVERSLRWCRRNPRLAALAGAVLLLLLTVAAVSTVFAVVLDARRREIETAWRQSEANAEAARREEQRANDNAREALQRYRLLHDALTVVIDRVQKDLRAVPATSEARRQILEAAMKVLRRSVEEGPDSTRQPERSLAAAHMIMGDILVEQKKIEEAIQHYNRCHAILKVLYEADPENDLAAGNYAASLSRQGDLALEQRHDAAEALRLYRQALALQERSLAQPPPRPELTPAEIHRSLANSHQHLGEILLRSQPPALAEAGRHFGQALEHLDQSATVDSIGGQGIVEKVSWNLAQVEERQNHGDAAQRAYERGLKASKKLAEMTPFDRERAIRIARQCGRIGDAYLFAEDARAAQRFYQDAVATAESLVRRDNQPGLRVLLSLNYYRRATANLRLGNRAAAEADYSKCLDLRVQLHKQLPDNLDLRIDLMIAQGRCGLHGEAAAFARELRQRYPDKPVYLLHAACGYALAVFGLERGKSADALTAEEQRQRREYSTHAVEALRQAKSKGYSDIKNLRCEPDLDPIRQDESFRQLMREYEGVN